MSTKKGTGSVKSGHSSRDKHYSVPSPCFVDKLVSLEPMFHQFRVLLVVETNIAVVKHPNEEVVNLPCHIQDVFNPARHKPIPQDVFDHVKLKPHTSRCI